MKQLIWDCREAAEKVADIYCEDFNRLVDIVERETNRIGGAKAADIFGHSLINGIYKMCEVVVNIICWEHASINGTFPFFDLKDVANTKKEIGIKFPPIAKVYAKCIVDIKKECDKSFEVNMVQIVAMLLAAMQFIESIETMVGESLPFIDRINHALYCNGRFVEHMIEDIRHNLECLIIPEDKEFTDEELDQIYALKSKGKDTSISAVYIMEVMRRHSDKNNKLLVKDVICYLEHDYGIVLERKAIARKLNQLVEADFLSKVYKEQGYWFDMDALNRRETGCWDD